MFHTWFQSILVTGSSIQLFLHLFLLRSEYARLISGEAKDIIVIWKDLYSVSSTSIHIPPVSQLPAHGHLDKLSTKVCFFWATKHLYTNTIYQRHWRSTYWSEIAIKQHKQLQQYYKLKQFQVVSLLILYINRSFSRLTDLIEYRIIYYIIILYYIWQNLLGPDSTATSGK